MVARTAPAVLALLADGVARPRSAIITALADQHPKEDVVRTLMRLAVTGQLVEAKRKYSLAPTAEPEGEGLTRSLPDHWVTAPVSSLGSALTGRRAPGARSGFSERAGGPKAPQAGAGQAACCSSFGCRLCNRSTAF